MSAQPPRIFITGFMGAGKTTVAAALARRLDCPMIDLDALITAREDRSISAIIDEEGEARFRDIETRALQVALDDQAVRVVALGGGTWVIERNRDLLAEHGGLVAWLDAPFELCWQRIVNAVGDARPLARDMKAARWLYDQRRALYRLAGLRIEVSAERSAEEIAAEIADKSNQCGAGEAEARP